MSSDHRRLFVFRGDATQTAAHARALLDRFDPSRVLWVGDEPDDPVPPLAERVGWKGLRRLLGTTLDAVVLNYHQRFEPDALGAAHGFVRGGGALVLRLGPADAGALGFETRATPDLSPTGGERSVDRPTGGERSVDRPTGGERAFNPVALRHGGAVVSKGSPTLGLGDRERLVVAPYGLQDVGRRAAWRFERALDRWLESVLGSVLGSGLGPVGTGTSGGIEGGGERVLSPLPSPEPSRRRGTADQDRAVAALVEHMSGGAGAVALVARRGRGKSAAIGLALARLEPRIRARVVVTGPSPESYAEVLRFAARDADEAIGGLQTCEPTALIRPATAPDPTRPDPTRPDPTRPDPARVIVVDEAAAIPVPVLQRIVRANPGARFVFATTTHGYEGTGRGFVLRFLDWLGAGGAPFTRLTLDEPIRWAAGDPVERFVFDALLLDAASNPPAALSPVSELRAVCFDRDALVRDPTLLGQVFGLLVEAHYRTTPSDLRRLLDAPNLSVHGVLDGDRVVAASLVAREGGLDEETANAMVCGRANVRGHALPDTFASHLGRAEGATLRSVRSVRIAVPASLRRHGVASLLVEHVHAHFLRVSESASTGSAAPPEVDLFGTVFGATAGLVAFRRSVGYEVVRISASRGARTGEPAVTMVRPVTDAARRLVADLRTEMARELSAQLACMAADDELVLDPALRAALERGLPSAPPWTADELAARARTYAFGPRTFESMAGSLSAYARARPALVTALPDPLRAVVEARAVEGRGWREARRRSGLPSPSATMRALRRGFAAMVSAEDGFSPGRP